LDCYTIDYDTAEDRSEEVAVARDVSDRLELAWKHIQYDYRAELLQGLEEAYRYFDQPCQQLALVYSKRLYDAMKPHCTVVLSGNGADELFTGYSGDAGLYQFDRTRRWLRHVPNWFYEQLPAQRRRTWSHVRLNRLSIPEWARGDIRAHAALFSAKPDVTDDCAQIADELAEELAEAGIDTMMDFVMHRALIVSAADTNYRLPDITGYAAQVEVRSPFLDHRMVEFAARLPHRFKVGLRNSTSHPKYIPRRFFQQFVGPKIAWSVKKGMGANLRWDLELVRNPLFIDAVAAAYQTLDRASIAAEPFKRAYLEFSSGVARGSSLHPSAGVMMNGFMLGCWLQREESPCQAE
jgi:asparagine synthase (glutamine-hydrolysing)